MKKFLAKFLLVNFLWLVIFSFFSFSENVFAWSPAIIDSSILSGTDNRIIEKKISWSNIQSSSLTTQIIPRLFELVFYIATSLAVLSLVYGWYLMLTDLWKNDSHKKWWSIFWFSIAWLVLMLLSRAIVWIISNLKLVKPLNDKDTGSASWIDYWLQESSHIWNLPSWNIETEVVPQFIQLALQFVSVVVIWVVIYSWIMYITMWDEKKGEMADLFINAVIWLIIILTSYVLVAWILNINFW